MKMHLRKLRLTLSTSCSHYEEHSGTKYSIRRFITKPRQLDDTLDGIVHIITFILCFTYLSSPYMVYDVYVTMGDFTMLAIIDR